VVARAAKNPPFTEKYDVECVLGRGGMGTVFEARHRRLGHHVAIKVLGEDLRLQPELVKRFEREARAAGALSSPHAVKVYDIDQTDDGTPFMVMELLHGRDLAHIVEHDGAQAVGDSVRWVIEACDAIGEAHRLGIVHRDIKPSNLFLCRDTETIKVLDFGIAKHVAAKEAAITLDVAPLGTPQYMSPEQVRCARNVDARTDIWSLGVTLYELLCGRPPFNHDVSQACIAAIVADPIPDPREHRPDLPESLVAVLMRALAKDPDERLQSVAELVLALAPFAEATASTDSSRIISVARRTAALSLDTLDGDDIALDAEVHRKATKRIDGRSLPPSVARMSARASRGRRRIDEQTVPPAVSRMSDRASRGKRVRSSIVLASAVVLGLGAIAATPRCVGARLDAGSTSVAVPPSVASGALARAVALPVAEPPIAGEAEPGRPSARFDGAEPGAERGDTATVRPPAPPATMKRSPKGGGAARPPRGGQARAIEGERPVHGGLSTPGF